MSSHPYEPVPLDDVREVDQSEAQAQEESLAASFPEQDVLLPPSSSLSQPSSQGAEAEGENSALFTSENSESENGGRPQRSTTLLAPDDGVFANLSAKPEVSHNDEPPAYDNSESPPSYYETTVFTSGYSANQILVEGLPVGTTFSFVWNLLVSMSFQFVGFLLTYILHSSHAAKQGSRAGLGITLVQYGFYIRSQAFHNTNFYPYYLGDTSGMGDPAFTSSSSSSSGGAMATDGGIVGGGGGSDLFDSSSKQEWLSYILMVIGWFILIRSTSEYIRAKKMENVIASIPLPPPPPTSEIFSISIV